ncbi:MAG: pyridoxal-phosphate dependent enzyme [Candidatus Dadabacteria bacterium]|nr:pyridoxal-phosphate dependent enzyme [Candidatus Dadabacteria bacterium]NIQ14224.1 pyridoxal-phosphate dependent enzyme [Candidatus Dadabacteria bacterium]
MQISEVHPRNKSKAKQRVNSVVELIGNTPLLKLSNITKDLSPDVEVYVKAEWFNPGGSIKDRPARKMVLEGIKSGELTKDKILMDSSSGNTAIAYAMIGAALQYKVELVTPLNINIERKKALEAYGAKIIYSDPLEGSDGAIRLAHKLKNENPDKYFMPDQYNNINNPLSHYETTAPEIWEQTGGKVTHFLAGLGTSGTFMGASRKLKELNGEIYTIAIQPAESLHGLEGMKHMPTSIVPGIYDSTFPDEIKFVSTEDSYNIMKRLMDEEGLFIGHSGGASVFAALECAKSLNEGVIVTILPDAGYRYLSGELWW